MTLHKLTVELTELEHAAWSVFVPDPQEWVETLVRHEVARAMRNIYEREVERLTADPDTDVIPANIETVVSMADLTSAKEREAAIVERMKATPNNGPVPGDV